MHDFLVFPNRAGINQPTLPESPRGRSARRMGGGGGELRARWWRETGGDQPPRTGRRRICPGLVVVGSGLYPWRWQPDVTRREEDEDKRGLSSRLDSPGFPEHSGGRRPTTRCEEASRPDRAHTGLGPTQPILVADVSPQIKRS